jgi:hypothetical protein
MEMMPIFEYRVVDHLALKVKIFQNFISNYRVNLRHLVANLLIKGSPIFFEVEAVMDVHCLVVPVRFQELDSSFIHFRFPLPTLLNNFNFSIN